MSTATDVSTTPRKARATVPALAAPKSSPALDELTGGDTPRLVTIPLDLLYPHPDNPRRDVGDVTELSVDIATNGLDQALVVVPHPEVRGAYRVVIGHRRRFASIAAGLTAVACRIREDLTPAQQRQMMVRENVHRADLTAVEEADAYQAMLELDGLTVEAIAVAVSRSESTVRSRLRIAKLPEQAREAVHAHRATLEDAAALAEFADDTGLHNKLADDLGTDSFRFAVQSARRTRTVAALFEPLLRRVREANATELGFAAWSSSAPDGLVHVAQIWSSALEQGSQDERVVKFAEAIGQVTTGWAYRAQSGTLDLFRPLTLKEAQAAADRQARSDAIDASRAADQARWAAEQQAREARSAATREFVTISAGTREEFLRGALAKKLTGAQTAALFDYTAHTLVAAAREDYEYGEFLLTDPAELAAWLGFDLEDIDAHAHRPDRPLVEVMADQDPVDAAFAGALDKLDTPRRILLALVAAAEPMPWHTFDTPNGRAWYALLELLGYPVSDAERTALAGGDVGSAERP